MIRGFRLPSCYWLADYTCYHATDWLIALAIMLLIGWFHLLSCYWLADNTCYHATDWLIILAIMLLIGWLHLLSCYWLADYTCYISYYWLADYTCYHVSIFFLYCLHGSMIGCFHCQIYSFLFLSISLPIRSPIVAIMTLSQNAVPIVPLFC